MSKESAGVFIPFADLQNYKPIITTELLVYSLIRGYERNAGFKVENTDIGICVATTDNIAETLNLTPQQVRAILEKLQYRHCLGARVGVTMDGKNKKYWCSRAAIRKLAEAGMIPESDRNKIEKIISR